MALPEVPLRKELYSSRQEASMQKQLASLPSSLEKIITSLARKEETEKRQKTKSLQAFEKQYEKINDINVSLKGLTDSQELTTKLLKDIVSEFKNKSEQDKKADSSPEQDLKGFGGDMLKKLLLGSAAGVAGIGVISSFFSDKETTETETEIEKVEDTTQTITIANQPVSREEPLTQAQITAIETSTRMGNSYPDWVMEKYNTEKSQQVSAPATPVTPTPVTYNEALEKYKAEELAQVLPGSGGGAQAEALMQAEQRAQRETGFKPEVTRVELTPSDLQQKQEEVQRDQAVTTQISGAFERRASRPQVDETSDEFKTLKEKLLTEKIEEEKSILGRNLLPAEQADIESQVSEETRTRLSQQNQPEAKLESTPVASVIPTVPDVQQVATAPIATPMVTNPESNYQQLLEKYKAEELAQVQPGAGGGSQAEAITTAEQRAQKETGFKPELTRVELTPSDIQQRQQEQQVSEVAGTRISEAFEKRTSRTQVDETSDEFKTLREQILSKKLEEEQSYLGRKLLPAEQADIESQVTEETRTKILETATPVEQTPAVIPQPTEPIATPESRPSISSTINSDELIDRLRNVSRNITSPDERTITRMENITRMLQEKDFEGAAAAIERMEKQYSSTDREESSRDVLRQRFESISGSRPSTPGQQRSSMEGSYQVASAAQTTMTDATYIPETSKDDLASSSRPSFMNTITSVQQAPSTSPNVSGPGPAPTADKIESVESGKPTSEKPENVRVASTANVDKVDKDLLGRFYAAAKEYGKPVTITSGFRDDEKQAELWVRANVFREPGIYMPAKPDRETTINYRGQTFKVPGGRTRSSHGGSSPTATAIDISRADADAMDSMGLFAKYGLNRPFPNDPVHIQKKGGTATPHVEEPATPQEVQATQVKSESVTTATGSSGESDTEGGVATPMQGEQTTATGGAGASGPAATMTPGAPSSGAAALTASVGNEVAKRTPAESAPPISPETPSAPNAGAGDTSYSSSTSDPGNVEPADAATRYRELFGLMAA